MNHNKDKDKDDYFIGYLDMPQKHRRFLLQLTPALLLFSGGLGALVSSSQNYSGNANWDSDVITLKGVFILDPYPTMITESPDGELVKYYLVNSGKHALEEHYARHVGKNIEISGLELYRDHMHKVRMFEVIEDSLTVFDYNHTMQHDTMLHSHDTEAIQVSGRIVDSKCWLGAMRPGTGYVHSGCGRLCLEGGIPPFFVGDNNLAYLMCDQDGAILDVPIGTIIDQHITLTATLRHSLFLPQLFIAPEDLPTISA
jgi:hypothetical protein